MVFTLVAFAFISLSFRKEYGVSITYNSIIIILIRQSIRLLDFENTRPLMTAVEWNSLVLSQTVVNSIIIPVVIIMFGNFKYNNVFMFICSSFTIYGAI